MEIVFEQRVPSPAEYKALRKSVDWPGMPDHLIEKGLSNSLHCVCVFIDGKIAGMGRVVGDDAIYFHIQDVIIEPEYQRLKIGSKIMEQLMDYIKSKGGTQTNVGLMCSKGREKFYEQFGFISRPNERFGAGMIQIMK